MNINEKEFINSIDDHFWKVIRREIEYYDILGYEDIDKEKFLKSLLQKINNHDYSVQSSFYRYFAKGNGVLRKTKSFSLEDLVVYYYCIKKIQADLSSKITENEKVYGGYRITPKSNEESKKDFIETLYMKDMIEPSKINSIDFENLTKKYKEYITKINSIPDEYQPKISKANFRKDWSEYQRLAREAGSANYNKYIHIDIAHFYDDVNLSILERDLRSVVKDNSNIIDLLFHFLRSSDSKDIGYYPSNTGIPQEEIGEMSRLLANFYLAKYDTEILKFLRVKFKGNNDFLYTRYSDDMWICFNGDEYDAYEVIQNSSLLLGKLKLHVNEKKTKIFTKAMFKDHWYFNEWDKLNKRKKDVEFLKSFYFSIIVNSNNRGGRWLSIIRYTFKVISSKGAYRFGSKGAKKFFKTILENPSIVENVETAQINFVKQLLEKNPDLISDALSFLNSKANIYPQFECFLLKVLSKVKRKEYKKVISEYLINRFLSSNKKDNFNWFARCICISYFIENIDFIRRKFDSSFKFLLTKINSIEYVPNSIERRYVIFFLHYYCLGTGKSILDEKYSEVNDISFIKYLNEKRRKRGKVIL
ncbi:reverse transcriptase domain-containing protein [Sporosarcina ureae]|uniref:reverse transcriptase domain-containing protein n=1 Tax=Sporosarcina ureae TaxID=1571 RepID=UPI0009DC7E74|nr:reverse transcriptase domain-containing protein [Sporosarcina ureae]ARF16727.1 hypothetical protein SporoP17a_05120 [Sporosarcina ureae]